MLLKTAVAKYLAHLTKRDLSPSHIKTVKWRLAHFTKRHPRQNVDDITKNDIAAYFKRLELERPAASCAGFRATQAAFWKHAKRKKWCHKNPIKGRKTYSYQSANPQPIPPEDLTAVANSLMAYALQEPIAPRNFRDALAVSLSLDSGKRRAEICNIRRRAMQNAMGNGQKMSNGRIIYLVRSWGKTGEVIVPFFEETRLLFQLWEANRPRSRVDYVFISTRGGGKLRPNTLGRAWRTVCEFANVRPFTSKQIRAQNITTMIRNEGDAALAQKYIGHADLQTTLRHYNTITRDDINEAAARLAAIRRGDAQIAELDQLFNPS